MRRLQLHLRGLYPHAVVHRRELAGEGRETWYVFRDGRVRVPAVPDGWWAAPGVAAVRIDRDGRVIRADRAAAGILGLEPAEIVGTDVRGFGVPGSFEDLALLFETALGLGEVDSIVRVMTRSGGTMDVAFHARPDGGEMEVAVAPVPAADATRPWFAPVCLPSGDALFVSRVESLCARLAPRDPLEVSVELEVRLRVMYSTATVRPLDRLVGFGAGTEVLLVYRDGEPDSGDRWWDRPGVAEVDIAGDRYVGANDAAAALHGVPRGDLVGARLGQFLFGGEDSLLLRDVLQRTGLLHTTVGLERGDGGSIDVEFRAVLRASDPLSAHIALRAAARTDEPATMAGGPGATSIESGIAEKAAASVPGQPDPRAPVIEPETLPEA
jgi:PAS domain S-box-containing protein